jgi:hypothetical protein
MDPIPVLGSHATSILPDRDSGGRLFCGSNISHAISIPLNPDQAKGKENKKCAIIKTGTGFFPSGNSQVVPQGPCFIAGFLVRMEAI